LFSGIFIYCNSLNLGWTNPGLSSRIAVRGYKSRAVIR
jgi:hypothetical protein